MALRLFSKTISLVMALQTACAVCGVLLADTNLHVYAEDTTTLHISQTEISEEQTETVAVQVSISGNADGFRATSFGLQYDDDLVLTEIQTQGDVGAAHTAVHNAEHCLIWLQGAGSGSGEFNTVQEEVFLTLYFSLPEDAGVGDSYPVSFVWEDIENREAYWYTENRSNIIGNIKSRAENGGIFIPDPNAPKLDATELQVNLGETASLTLENYSGNITWFSDNIRIASVSDGTITGVSEGTCRIYAATNGEGVFSCTVTVTKERYYDVSKITTVLLTDPEEVVILECPDTENVTWISSDSTIVTIENGVLSGHQNGEASIYVISGTQVYTVQVIVQFPGSVIPGNGDVNCDGEVTIIDVVMLCRCSMGAETLTPEGKIAADAYQDGIVDATDAVVILQSLVDLVSLPVIPD